VLLQDKVCMIHGAGGAIGGAVARTFAREGARLFLSGRNLASADAVASEIVAAGGRAEAAQVDAFDERAVERHTAGVADKAGRIDAVLNAVGFKVVQGIPLIDLAPADFAAPIANWTTTQFLTARAAARHMVQKRSGVILTLSSGAVGHRFNRRIWCRLRGDRGPDAHARSRAQSPRCSRRVHPAAPDRRHAWPRSGFSPGPGRVPKLDREHDTAQAAADA
jgi:NAD(P)-dependent dehydrogenase (short-subunit alcohol dehydrogenase family)